MKLIGRLLGLIGLLSLGRAFSSASEPFIISRSPHFSGYGSSFDFGSGMNIGMIEYARRHNHRGKIVRRMRGC